MGKKWKKVELQQKCIVEFQNCKIVSISIEVIKLNRKKWRGEKKLLKKLNKR